MPPLQSEKLPTSKDEHGGYGKLGECVCGGEEKTKFQLGVTTP